MMRRAMPTEAKLATLVLLALSLHSGASASNESRPEVRVGVFGLFHPRGLVVSAAGSVVSLRGDRNSCVLRGGEEARVDLDGGSVHVACPGALFSTRSLHVTGPTGQSADLRLSVPGSITRRFQGRLDVILGGDELVPVVSMDLETAVASVVAAEQIGSTPPEALKAQAVAARSFFVADRHRHRGFDFCDTTHCQFLRERPAADHAAARAARETAGLVLAFRGAPISAFYSASCGGRTRTLADAGLEAAGGYPYFSVECVRRHAAGDRKGHGIGLCQEGAASLAADRGASYADILQHYYPGTTVETRP
jgi:stage II sporulation protein D (peptidoglycan lytic transglycosylase)